MAFKVVFSVHTASIIHGDATWQNKAIAEQTHITELLHVVDAVTASFAQPVLFEQPGWALSWCVCVCTGPTHRAGLEVSPSVRDGNAVSPPPRHSAPLRPAVPWARGAPPGSSPHGQQRDTHTHHGAVHMASSQSHTHTRQQCGQQPVIHTQFGFAFSDMYLFFSVAWNFYQCPPVTNSPVWTQTKIILIFDEHILSNA